jgi:hypothetical protein
MKIHLRARLTAVATVFLAVLLSSCAVSGFGNSRRRVPFNESEFATYRGSGSATVSGQLAVTSSEGAVHVGNFGGSTAGIRITLIPVTAYTREMVEREIGDGIYLGASDPRFRKYVRLTTTDGNGAFAFEQIPAGEYFVSGLGEWIDRGYFKHQWACERVTVAGGQSVRISLTQNLHRAGRPLLRLWALE